MCPHRATISQPPRAALHVYGDYEGTFTQSYSGDQQSLTTLLTGSGSLRSAPPTRLAFGVGVALDRLTLELDAARAKLSGSDCGHNAPAFS